MHRIKMCHELELPAGGWIEKRILARRVAVFNDGSSMYGIEADCKHMKASLVGGEVNNGIVTCRWHGWKYDLRTGRCLTVDRLKLKVYDVEIVDEQVYVLID